jgi:ribosome assembly protein YihI (activator of Der GTPase)
MADRPHSRKVKVVEGVAQVKKGERIESDLRARDRDTAQKEKGKSQGKSAAD